MEGGKRARREVTHWSAVDRKGRRIRILGRVNPWSRGSEVEVEVGVGSEGVVEEVEAALRSAAAAAS